MYFVFNYVAVIDFLHIAGYCWDFMILQCENLSTKTIAFHFQWRKMCPSKYTIVYINVLLYIYFFFSERIDFMRLKGISYWNWTETAEPIEWYAGNGVDTLSSIDLTQLVI